MQQKVIGWGYATRSTYNLLTKPNHLQLIIKSYANGLPKHPP